MRTISVLNVFAKHMALQHSSLWEQPRGPEQGWLSSNHQSRECIFLPAISSFCQAMGRKRSPVPDIASGKQTEKFRVLSLFRSTFSGFKL